MSDTPRTDAQGYGDGRHPYVPTEFARQLERELEQAKDGWRDEIQKAQADMRRAERMVNEAKEELAQIKAVLADPLKVHLNMMRGTIAWTPANLRHLLGDTVQDP